MKATKIYHGISVIFTCVVLVLLFTTDSLYLADKAKFSVIISMFGTMELVKYFIVSLHSPDILKALSSSTTPYLNLAQRNSSDKKLKQALKGVMLIIATTVVYHLAIILLGAAVFENFEETFLLSLLLCVLTFLPLNLYFGPRSAVAALLNNYPTHVHSFEVTLRQNVYITLFGAWVGAFVIPLDWDRPWQKWPIPCAVGAMLGYGISQIIKVPSPQLTKYSV